MDPGHSAVVPADPALKEAGGDWQRRYCELEEELVELTATLCHDLRGPTRAAAGFARALHEGAALPAEEGEYVQQIRAAAEKMDHLIDAVARLGQVSRAPLALAAVDLGAMAEGILAELQAAEPGRAVPTTIPRGLIARADPRLLPVLLRELLDNAWAFTRPKPGAGIEVGREGVEEPPTFFIRDQGVGFDMRYLGKLFAPFRRLHPGDESQLGFGLTVARRIVRRHGGRLWAEGRPGQGGCFRFTLAPG